MNHTIAAGKRHSLVIGNQNRVWAFGRGKEGQLGLGTKPQTIQPTPKQIVDLSPIKSVAAGGDSSLALDVYGRIWSFGSNTSGQLGLGRETTERYSSIYSVTMIPQLTNIKNISVGYTHSLALDIQGRVWAFGSNLSGQLGVDNVRSHYSPVLILGLPPIREISAGGFYNLLLDEDGFVWVFGDNGAGQLGLELDGEEELDEPTKLVGLPPIQSISAGDYHSLLLDREGHIWAFGRHENGQLGLGRLDDWNQGTPEQIPLDIKFTHISAGGNHSLAIDERGHLWGFGLNNVGQIGLEYIDEELDPQEVESSVLFIDISAGEKHSLALSQDGHLYVFWFE